MTKTTFTVASEEGKTFAAGRGSPADLGEEVELDLNAEEKKALVAAGWLEEQTTKKKGG